MNGEGQKIDWLKTAVCADNMSVTFHLLSVLASVAVLKQTFLRV